MASLVMTIQDFQCFGQSFLASSPWYFPLFLSSHTKRVDWKPTLAGWVSSHVAKCSVASPLLITNRQYMSCQREQQCCAIHVFAESQYRSVVSKFTAVHCLKCKMYHNIWNKRLFEISPEMGCGTKCCAHDLQWFTIPRLFAAIFLHHLMWWATSERGPKVDLAVPFVNQTMAPWQS